MAFVYISSGKIIFNGISNTQIRATIIKEPDFPDNKPGDSTDAIFWENRFNFSDLYSGKINV